MFSCWLIAAKQSPLEKNDFKQYLLSPLEKHDFKQYLLVDP